MEIVTGIHWIEAGGSNMYLCVEAEGLTLIDAGLPKKQDQVFAVIEQTGCQLTDLKQILVTHADYDHVGSLAAIQAETGAKIYAGQQTASLLAQGKSPKHLPRVAQVFADRFIKYQPVAAVTIITCVDGESLPFLGGIQVMATPGHTSDHFSFYCPQSGVLFVGDALNTRNGRINPSPKRITADREAANQSAIRLLQLTPAVLACGHGAPLTNHSSQDLMAAFNLFRSE